jgi:hypothetical protein
VEGEATSSILLTDGFQAGGSDLGTDPVVYSPWRVDAFFSVFPSRISNIHCVVETKTLTYNEG